MEDFVESMLNFRGGGGEESEGLQLAWKASTAAGDTSCSEATKLQGWVRGEGQPGLGVEAEHERARS